MDKNSFQSNENNQIKWAQTYSYLFDNTYFNFEDYGRKKTTFAYTIEFNMKTTKDRLNLHVRWQEEKNEEIF